MAAESLDIANSTNKSEISGGPQETACNYVADLGATACYVIEVVQDAGSIQASP